MSNLGNGGLQLGDLTQESSREQTQRQGHLLLQLCATCNLLDRRSCQAAGHERTGTGKRMAGVHKDLLQVLLNGACTAPERTVLIALLLGFIRSCPPCCHRTNRSPTNARTEKNRTEKNKKKTNEKPIKSSWIVPRFCTDQIQQATKLFPENQCLRSI